MELYKTSKKERFCITYRTLHEESVKPDLVTTPKQIYELSSAGMSVSMPDGSNYYDGDKNPSFDMLPENRRGMDVADLYQLEQSAKKHIVSKYHKVKRETSKSI